MNSHTTPPPALYLRIDGTLMLARADGTTIEMCLAPAQLLQLGFDALQVAVSLKPDCLPEAMQALEGTLVQVPTQVAEGVPCARLN